MTTLYVVVVIFCEMECLLNIFITETMKILLSLLLNVVLLISRSEAGEPGAGAEGLVLRDDVTEDVKREAESAVKDALASSVDKE